MILIERRGTVLFLFNLLLLLLLFFFLSRCIIDIHFSNLIDVDHKASKLLKKPTYN